MIGKYKNIITQSKNKIGLFSYPIRIIVYSFVIIVTYFHNENNLSNILLIFLISCSLIPHFSILSFLFFKNKRTSVITFYFIDAIMASFFIINVEFSYFASFAIITTVFSSSLALRGVKFTFLIFSLFLGCSFLLYYFNPFEFHLHSSLFLNKISAIYILVYVVIFSLSGYFFTRNISILKNKVSSQNLKISNQMEKVEKRTLQINSRIEYAKKIQEIMLPNDELFLKHFKDFFIYYKPLHHVSGDFYWLKKEGPYTFLLCVDCTGHGIPGGFMSMISYQLLEETICEKKIYDPCNIFKELHKELNIRLRQDNSQNTDGMAISLVRFEEESRKITIAGSYHPVIIYSNNVFQEIKTTRRYIGGTLINKKRVFENVELELEPDSIIYLFTDGITDQLGNGGYKKIGYKRILETIRQSVDLPFIQQRNNIEKTITDWKDEVQQTDDLTFIAVKI